MWGAREAAVEDRRGEAASSDGYDGEGGLTDEEIQEHETNHPPIPGNKQHRCTDVSWLVVWLLCFALLVAIRRYAHENSKLDKFFNGYDINNRSCGVDPGVEDAKYLFWCLDHHEGESIDEHSEHLRAPMCVAKCPTNATERRVCNTTKGESHEVFDYPTIPVAHWCAPKNKTETTLMLNAVLGDGTVAASLKIYRDIHYCWKSVFLISGILAVIMGGIYLIVLNICASLVLMVCKVGLVVCSFWSSWFFFNSAYPMGLLGEWLKDTGNAGMSGWQHHVFLVLCGMFFVVGCFFLLWFVCSNKNPAAAIGCIEAASECMVAEKAFFVEPFLATFLKLLVLAINLVSTLWIISLGDIKPDGRMGIRKSIEFDGLQWFFLIYNAFMFIWSQEIVSNLSEYAIAWATQMWYFTPTNQSSGEKQDKKKTFLVFKGYGNAMRYHMGTIAIGSLLLAYLRPFRIATEFIARAIKGPDNPMRAICSCCIQSFERCLIYVSRSAYLDVALTSSDFFTSSNRAINILTMEVPEIKTLNGAQLIFQISGTWMITYSCAYVTLLYTSSAVWQEGEVFVEDTTGVAMLAGGQAFFISTCFMNVFDTVGETILYCFASEQRRRKNLDKHRMQTSYEDNYTVQGTMGNLWSFFAGDDSEEEEGHVDYAPQRLKEVIHETRRAMQEEEGYS